MILDRDSTEYLYVGVSGQPPADAEIALLTAGARPLEDDWIEAGLVLSDADDLWADAVASGSTGDYFVALLVGSYGDNPVVLAPGDYQVWVRLTDTTERPVRIAPVALEVV